MVIYCMSKVENTTRLLAQHYFKLGEEQGGWKSTGMSQDNQTSIGQMMKTTAGNQTRGLWPATAGSAELCTYAAE